MPSGNTAQICAELAPFSLLGQDGSSAGLLSRVKHISLNEDAQFQDIFVEEMTFPK